MPADAEVNKKLLKRIVSLEKIASDNAEMISAILNYVKNIDSHFQSPGVQEVPALFPVNNKEELAIAEKEAASDTELFKTTVRLSFMFFLNDELSI